MRDFADKSVHKALAHRAAGKPAQEKPPRRYDCLNELAEATEDPRQLRDEPLNILFAGRDTTASLLLSNTFHLLAHRLDIWSKLKAENRPARRREA